MTKQSRTESAFLSSANASRRVIVLSIIVAGLLLCARVSTVASAQQFSSQPAAKPNIADRPLNEKVRVAIIIIGEVTHIGPDYSADAPKPDNIFESRQILVTVKPIEVLKGPVGAAISENLYFTFGEVFPLPLGRASTWSDLISTFAGRRYVFFAYEMREVRAGIFHLKSGNAIRPELPEREREIRQLLGSR